MKARFTMAVAIMMLVSPTYGQQWMSLSERDTSKVEFKVTDTQSDKRKPSVMVRTVFLGSLLSIARSNGYDQTLSEWRIDCSTRKYRRLGESTAWLKGKFIKSLEFAADSGAWTPIQKDTSQHKVYQAVCLSNAKRSS